MSSRRVILEWLVSSLIYGLIAAVTLIAIMVVAHLLGRPVTTPYSVLILLMLFVGMVAAMPGALKNAKQHRGDK